MVEVSGGRSEGQVVAGFTEALLEGGRQLLRLTSYFSWGRPRIMFHAIHNAAPGKNSHAYTKVPRPVINQAHAASSLLTVTGISMLH